MSKQNPAEAPQGEQQAIDYESMSTEELEERLARGEGIIREDAPPPAPPEPEPQPEPPQEAEAPAQAEPPEELEEESPEPEMPTAATTEQLEELRLQLDLANSARERSELLGGRAASELGNLRKQVQQMQQALTQPRPQVDPDGYQPEFPPQAPYAPQYDPMVGSLQAKVAGLEQADRTRAAEAEYNDFVAQNFQGDAEAAGQFLQAAQSSLQQQFAAYEGMDLEAQGLRKLLRVSLNTALAEHRLANLRAQSQARVASQVPEKKKAKQAAATSGSGGTPAPKARPKTAEEMTAEEADAALIREFGDGHRSRRFR